MAQQTLTAAVRAGASDAAQRIAKHLSPAVAKSSDFVAERAEGTYIYTTDGQKHLDMAAGIGVVSTGHCHPKVVKAIQDQASQLIHSGQNIFTSNVAQVGLLDRMLKIVPPGLTRLFFANSGSEAVDNAIKVARAHTKRQNIICFENSFHGRTFGAMALTTSKTYYRQGFAPLMPQVVVAPYPYCLHCKVRQAHPEGDSWYKIQPNVAPYDSYTARTCCNAPMESLKWILKQQSAPSETAAIIVEPIMGEGGFLTPPPSFLPTLRKICDEHGIVLIIDEVQAGVARTGKWWGHQHVSGEAMHPDILIFAKGIASGFPFAGLATRDDMFDGLALGTMGGTYGAAPLACATANATLDVIVEENLLENATQRGLQLTEGLVQLADKYPIIDVRGRGLMCAVEFGGHDGSMTASPGVAAAVTKAAGKRNMLLLTAGARESVRFLPPLTVSEGEIAEALSIFGDCLEDVFGISAQQAATA
ncbi:g9827 [Coccomyxa viridis]|uniref:G9827 protein n=1 Tax=Coccomyxa viridis TaxID=1274662 RepID=A0ABP1GA26_9CHLO